MTIDNNVDVSQNSHININGAVLEKKHAQILRGEHVIYIKSKHRSKNIQLQDYLKVYDHNTEAKFAGTGRGSNEEFVIES